MSCVNTSNSTKEEDQRNDPPWTCIASPVQRGPGRHWLISEALRCPAWWSRPVLGMLWALQTCPCQHTFSQMQGHSECSLVLPNYQRGYSSTPIRKKFFLVFFLSLEKFEKMNTCVPNILLIIYNNNNSNNVTYYY